jgi:hypothetical protein
LTTCVDCYAFCNGSICDCVDGFTWNGTLCGKQNLMDERECHTQNPKRLL